MRLSNLLIFLILCGTSLLPAQILVSTKQTIMPDAPATVRIGVVAGGNFTLHVPNFTAVPGFSSAFYLPYTPADGIQSDASFRSSLVANTVVGGLLEMPFGENFHLSLRGAYTAHSGQLAATQRFYDADDIFPTFDHTLTFTLSTLNAELCGVWKPFAEAAPNLAFSLGATAALSFGERTFQQISRLTGAGANFPLLPKPDIRGQLPDGGVMLSAVAGVGYELPLPIGAGGVGGRLLLVPEVSAVMGFTPVVAGFGGGSFWNMLQFRPAVALKYEFPRLFERTDEYEQRDTVRVQKSLESLASTSIPDSLVLGERLAKRDTTWIWNVRRTAILARRTDTLITTNVVIRKPAMQFSIAALGVMPDGKEMAVPEVRIEEIIGQKYFPLLNYIFFPEGASELAARYIRLTPRERAAFEPTRLISPSDPLYIYHHILNVLADRMARIPEMTVTLTGCNADVGIEKGNRSLSEARTLAVKQYLCGAWEIVPERITIQTRNLPEKPSLPLTEADKREENRRVEIVVSLPEYFKWVVTADTVRTANPPTARFITQVKSETAVRRWRLSITHKGDTVRTFDSAGAPPQIFDWEFAKEARMQGRDLALLTEPFVLHPELLDSAGNSVHSETVSLPIKQITVQKKRRERRQDKEFEEFSMMLFEFNQATLTAEQTETINFIKSHVKVLSELAITGYTDRTGTAEYDRKLSLERAQQISRAILGEKISPEQVVVRGVGKDELLYDNTIPEGRFYCRTVKVTIQTPVN